MTPRALIWAARRAVNSPIHRHLWTESAEKRPAVGDYAAELPCLAAKRLENLLRQRRAKSPDLRNLIR